MGNYKSRPQSSCTEELKKKIGELHSVLSARLTSDLRLLEPASLSELQEACCMAEVPTGVDTTSVPMTACSVTMTTLDLDVADVPVVTGGTS